MCLVKMDKVNWVETAIHPITISSSLDYMYYTMYCYLRQELLCTQTYFRTPVYRKAKGQVISKCLLGVIVSTKKPTKFF